MTRMHDRGGRPIAQPIDNAEHALSDWERKVDAMVQVLVRKGVMTVDQLRRAIEALPQERYEAMAYYERWADALERLLGETGLVDRAELEGRVADLEGRAAQGARHG